MTRCIAHTYGCGCKTECAKTIDLGRFKTALTTSEEQRIDLMRKYNNMANACVALGLVAAIMTGALIRAYAVDVRQAQIEQEVGRWQTNLKH